MLVQEEEEALDPDCRSAPCRSLPTPPAKVVAPHSGVCLVDPALQTDFRRALRIFERDVPLLINGETGCGKEAFAKAYGTGISSQLHFHDIEVSNDDQHKPLIICNKVTSPIHITISHTDHYATATVIIEA